MPFLEMERGRVQKGFGESNQALYFSQVSGDSLRHLTQVGQGQSWRVNIGESLKDRWCLML